MFVAILSAAVLLTGVASAAPASARRTASSHYLLGHLAGGGEHPGGYARSKFRLWSDADHDGCDTRDEVLLAEAVKHPSVGAGCALRGGRWRSPYDGVTTNRPSGFDIDHLVPLAEAWQSGAWKWNAATRTAYANDLGYAGSLVAVTAHANRSKSDREPQTWLPARAAYRCTYVAQWVAVKWRWHLSVNPAERSFLHRELRACHWPRVAKPKRPAIGTSTGGSGGTGGTGGSTSPGPTVSYAVHPGAFCSEHGWYGRTSAGTLMRCTTTASDSRYRWRAA